MKILYVGELWKGSTSLDRMRALVKLGVRVVPFDKSPYTRHGSRISKFIVSRFHYGKSVSDFNRDLLLTSLSTKGLTHVWIDKGILIFQKTLNEIKEKLNVKLIHYTPDPALLFHKSVHFIKCIPIYDILFTTKPFEIELYKKTGAKKVHLTYQAFEASRFFPRTGTKKRVKAYESDVCFIGHFEKHYARILSAVADAGFDLKIWGPGWTSWRYGRRYWSLRNAIQGEGLWDIQYPLALCNAKICLGLLSKYIPETTTTRTFEIPACGSLLLAERTREHSNLFEEGIEADFFSKDNELIDKISFYLKNEKNRKKMEKMGRKRCIRSGYDNISRIKEMLEFIKIN
jgi:spore maturation protein CgeB